MSQQHWGCPDQVHHLIDSILNDTSPRYTGEDGVHTVQCTLATIRSVRDHRPVKVAEIEPEYTAYECRYM